MTFARGRCAERQRSVPPGCRLAARMEPATEQSRGAPAAARDPRPRGRVENQPGANGEGAPLALACGLATLACVGLLLAELYLLGGHLGLPLDDGWIHLQFARNLAHGAGLAYNPGERVAGSTAPLWTA